MITRRDFLKSGMVAGSGVTFFWHGDILYARPKESTEAVAVAVIPGGTLDPKTVPRFVTPLVIPPPMPNNGTPHHYDITVKQFTQQILPTGFPMTTVWSYGADNNLAGTLNYPAFTIEGMSLRSLESVEADRAEVLHLSVGWQVSG